MLLHGEHAAGAAMRRRQRRLRSWLRHERMTVAMTLAELTHHIAPRGPKMAMVGEVEEQVSHAGPRAQKTPPPGERPGILPEPLPQRSDRCRRHSSGDGLPQLALPSLAGAAGEAVDAAALAFLISQSLAAKEHEDRKKREEEAKEALNAWKVRRKRVKDEFVALIDTPTLTPLEDERLQELVAIAEAMDASKPGSSSASSSTRRKKKKRRKR